MVESWREVVVGEFDQNTLYKLKNFQMINKYYFKIKGTYVG